MSNKDNTLLISVILPVYNGEDHLKECIESILNQTFKEFEFIIVDDASTDNTAQMLKKFAIQDNRITVITHEVNQKQTAAANTAIKFAKGKYLARMDADDVALPMRLEQQLAYMEGNPIIGLLGSWVDIIDANGKILKIWQTHTTNGYLGWNLLFGTSFAHSSVMMKNESANKAGLYQSPEAEDYDLWSRISRITEVANIPEVLQQKRVWAGQLALKVPTETRDSVIQIMQKNINRLIGNSNLDLDMIRNIRKVSDKNPKIDDIKLISEVKNILLQLYVKYLTKHKLTNIEKKNISRDIFKKLNTLANWQYTANSYKGLIDKFYLVYHFPKLYLYSLFQRK
jgi:glycosyltransferase involved in cell wall biosynthesis